jgi:hypothetical protein
MSARTVLRQDPFLTIVSSHQPGVAAARRS